MFAELFKYRDLLFMLAQRDIKIRYKQSVMGFLWAIFMPMVAILAGVIIKKAMAIFSGQSMAFDQVVMVAVKVLPWTFFVSSIRFSVQSLVGNANLVTKIYFPREVLPLSAILASLFDFAVASITLGVLLAFAHVGVSINLLYLPLLLLFLIMFTAGVGLILSCANLFFRDVKYVVETILMFGIFYTPVFYEASLFGKWETLIMLNPIASILELFNSAIALQQAPDLGWLLYAGVMSVLMFFIGLAVFSKNEPWFAENI